MSSDFSESEGSSLILPEKSIAILECQTASCNASFSHAVEWHDRQGKINNARINTHIRSNGQLEITSLTSRNEGAYSCHRRADDGRYRMSNDFIVTALEGWDISSLLYALYVDAYISDCVFL